MNFPLARGLGPLGRSRSHAAPFSPADIAGLQCRLRAGSLGLADGDLLSSWTDTSGNGRSPTAAGADRPTFKAGVLNGQPVVRFSFNKLAFASAFVTLPFSVFVVGDSSRSPAANPPQEWLAVGDCILAAQVDTGTGVNWGVYDGSSWSQSSSPAVSSVFRAVGYVRKTTANYSLWTGATEQPKTSGGTPLALAQALVGSDDFGQSLEGDIAEILIYSGALSDADVGRVLGYLASEYAL